MPPPAACLPCHRCRSSLPFRRLPSLPLPHLGVATRAAAANPREGQGRDTGLARAAEEYCQLERGMLDRHLARTLPYVKSLFLGWFEPLRDAVARDQDVQRRKRVKHVYAKYLLLLPAEKIFVIIMHKMMGLLISLSLFFVASSRPVHGSHRPSVAALYLLPSPLRQFFHRSLADYFVYMPTRCSMEVQAGCKGRLLVSFYDFFSSSEI